MLRQRTRPVGLLSGIWTNRSHVQPELLRFQTLLRSVDVVSFDLFDTLIHRDGLFSPKDLFYQVQSRAEHELGIALPQFAELRVRAEERARVYARGQGRQEVRLDEIYSELARLLRLRSTDARAIQAVELACERATLVALDSGRELFEAAVAAGKQVILISDTYFDEAFIADVVAKLGYAALRNIYVSSTHGKTKQDASLYDVAIKQLGCPPGRILHVGDNQLADVSMALGRGLRSFFVPTPKHHLKWRHGLADLPSGNLVVSRMLYDLSRDAQGSVQDLRSILDRTATHNLALLFFGFAAWLVERLRAGAYQRVYFAARDGLVMKRFFDLVAATAGFEIDSRYLYISRAALYPSLVFTDPVMARRLFGHSWDHLTIEAALARIGLSFTQCRAMLAGQGLFDPRERLDGEVRERFVAFLQEAWPLIQGLSEQQYWLTIDYLRQEGLLDHEKAAFVDIGWHGSLQNSLLKLLDHLRVRKSVSGYYLGTFEKPSGASPRFKSHGYLVDNSEPGSITQLVRLGPSLIELFHSAGHGSVRGYRAEGTRVLPVLDQHFDEQWQYLSIIEPLQKRAYEHVEAQLARLAAPLLPAPAPELVARTALRVIYAPTPAEAAVFGQLKIAPDFGGRAKSITGAIEYDLKHISGEYLPDGTVPLWRPGFHALKKLSEKA
jgi:predicted HAD superfamily hydrolase